MDFSTEVESHIWLIVNGHASVILFFLLSGFVLTLPSLRGTAQAYPQYVVRRVCRIYLPYLVGLSFALLGCSLFWGRYFYGPAVTRFWSLSPDVPSLMQHLVMVGRFDVYRYDIAFWSLVHEMRISLIFPLILFCALRFRVWAAVAVSALCSLTASLSLMFIENGLPGPVRITAWSFTLSYCGVFLLGAALARRHQEYAGLVDRLSTLRKAAVFSVATILYLYPPKGWRGIDMGDFFSACGGLVILTFCLRHHGTFARWLRLAPMQFLGRVSYSLYLIHHPILLALAYLFYGRFPFPVLLLPFVGISLASAAVMHRFIELPSIALGRRLSRF